MLIGEGIEDGCDGVPSVPGGSDGNEGGIEGDFANAGDACSLALFHFITNIVDYSNTDYVTILVEGLDGAGLVSGKSLLGI